MALVPGTRLGAYEILTLLGSGGMGEVYRAKDTKLDRDVALKILPDTFTHDPDRIARFRREAQVLASLNHPHIAQIHGLDESNGTQFLVLELVDGESLDRRIARGPIPVDEALAIAKQIAEALEAAHEKGIIHRDLKPANIALTKDGHVKVLDFGLAKAVENPSGSVDAMSSPTITSPAMMTDVGVILGTAAYMSPEQARGKSVDRRTDIWAFGCVFYEMLTGKRAFDSGDTGSDTIAAVLTREPDWNKLPAPTATGVRRLMERCLRKDQRERLQDIGDARVELTDLARTIPAARVQSIGVHALAIAVLTVAIVVIIAWLAGRAKSVPPPRGATRLEMNLPTGVEAFLANGVPLAISPDGSIVAFIGSQVGARQVYLRHLDQGTSIPVRGIALPNLVLFSRDGRQLLVASTDLTLRAVSIVDGSISSLARNVTFQGGVAQRSDGRIVIARESVLWLLGTADEARRLTSLESSRREIGHRWPMFLPGDKTLLFSAFNNDGERIESLEVSSEARRVVLDNAAFPRYAASGHLLFVRDGAVFAVAFNAERLTVSGPPSKVIEDVSLTAAGAPLLTLSDTGALLYGSGGNVNGHLVAVSRAGVERLIDDRSGVYSLPRIAHDGRRIAVKIGNDLWLQDLIRRTATRLTNEANAGVPAGQINYSVWMPDDRSIVYRSPEGVKRIQTDGSGRVELIPQTSVQDFPTSVSPDGKILAFSRLDSQASSDIYSLSLMGDPNPQPVIQSRAYEGGAQFSADGRWLAYTSDEAGQSQVYIARFDASGAKWQVSTQGGTQPRWNPIGKELFYRNGNKMMSVMITDDRQTSVPQLSAPTLLFERRYSNGPSVGIPNFDVTPDGLEFVMIRDDPSSLRFNVVLDWIGELKARVPTR